MGAYDEGEGEGVPVFVGVGWVVAGGFEGCPVFSVVAGDVGAVGAYGDPEFLGGVVGYGGAVAVGWSLGGGPVLATIKAKCSRAGTLVNFFIVSANNHARRHSWKEKNTIFLCCCNLLC